MESDNYIDFYPPNYEPAFPQPLDLFFNEDEYLDKDNKNVGKPMKTSSEAKKYKKISLIFMTMGIFLLSMSWGPSIFYFIANKAGVDLNSFTIRETVIKKDELSAKIRLRPTKFQPQLDTSLPTENRLKIPSVRIDTVINEADDSSFEDALRKGVWRVSEFGTPYDRNLPTILAAHRFGYLAWSVPYRLKNSFYSLPKLKIGDTVEIIWDQRKYVYAIYAEGEGIEITNRLSDLILYTCKDLNSEIRIFKYGKLLEI